MSSGIDLRTTHALELATKLQQTVTTFAKKEEQLARDLRTQRSVIDRRYREGMTAVESKRTTQTAAIEESAKLADERARATYESRRNRIQQAKARALKNLPRRAAEAKKRWQGDLQMKHFRAERALASGNSAVEKEFTQFAQRLAQTKSAHDELDRRARHALSGYGALGRALKAQTSAAPEKRHDPSERDQLMADFEARLATAGERLADLRANLATRIFSIAPIGVLLGLILVGGGVGAFLGGPNAYPLAGAGVAILGGLVCALYFIGKKGSAPAATVLVEALVEARTLRKACGAAAQEKHDDDIRRLQEEYDRVDAEVKAGWDQSDQVETDFENTARQRIEMQVPRAFERNARQLTPKLNRIGPERTAKLAALTTEVETKRTRITETYEAEFAEFSATERARWDAIEAEWKDEITPIYRSAEAMNAALLPAFPQWSKAFVESWTPLNHFARATKFAQFEIDAGAQGAPKDSRLALPGSSQISVPLALTFPERGSLLFETNEAGGPAVMDVLNNIILRLLTTTPPGKLTFTIIDPIGLGENFAGIMHLSDYEESVINRKIWTQRDQIDERLAELGEHIEKVIQMYLRNEYATITEYNEQAGSVAEKYHFLVVADFPAGFSETSARRLQSIALSGARCGIFTLIHWDKRHPLPDGFTPDELRKNSVTFRHDHSGFVLGSAQNGARPEFDPPPSAELAVELVHKIGKASIDSNRVEVPFVQIAPKPEEMWTNETTSELKIAIGRTGATKLQYLAIGKGTRQHALFAGKTGSGKSTLFHVIITNLALACSPDQVEFYLIDFKKGVEFKCYATKRLPHARVVAIESDREFGLNVLQRVDDELKRRGDIFRKYGVQDIPGYKRAGGVEPMPRTLLMIDEFQEFFVEDDTVAQTASLLFDRIVRQGRAFGIHVLLGSQTLGGAYSLARATLGQMVIRVALQCNEADAYLIMDDTNAAPRLLSRPGEGIYNDAAGALEGNSPFQVVWLSDEERDEWLDKVHDLAVKHNDRHPAPIVFEGNAPADIRENELLATLFKETPAKPPISARCWLGAPNSIKGPTEAVFHRQSGNHLLIVGQREEATVTMVGLSMLALASQYPLGAVRIYLIHSASPGSRDSEFLDRIVAACPQEITVARNQEIAAAINDVATEVKARSNGDESADGPPIFLIIHGLHKFKKLRHEDDFSFSSSDSDSGPNSGAQLNEIITEGSGVGVHIITTVDTFNNVNRSMSRKALTEFEMRVVFQMSANDSASLIDSPKASTLGLHRALYYNEHEGTLETFRPYAVPEDAWLSERTVKVQK